MNIDEGTKVGIELASEGIKLTANLLSFIFRKASEALEDKNIVTTKTKEGKQKIKDLLEKHKHGIETLDDNLTKEQVKDYQKELKKLGVDFSIVKNGRDNYSFFFAGNQASVIEKALKNIIDKENLLDNNKDVKETQKDINYEMGKLNKKEKENVINAYTEFYMTKDEKKYEKLSDKEKTAFDKMKKLDNIKEKLNHDIDKMTKEPPTEKQLNLAKKLGVKNYKEMNKKEISIALEEAGADPSYFNNKKNMKKNLNDRISKLNEKEINLYKKNIEYEILSTSISLEDNKLQDVSLELKKLEKEHSKNTLDKIKNIDKDIKEFDKFKSYSKNKLTNREILSEINKNIKERNNIKTFSMKNVKKIDQEIKKKESSKDRTKQIEHSR